MYVFTRLITVFYSYEDLMFPWWYIDMNCLMWKMVYTFGISVNLLLS